MVALIKINNHQLNKMFRNSKAKKCIIKAFALADVENLNIDFVIETLFYSYTKGQAASIRKAAVMSLDILHKKSQKL